LERDAYFVGA